MTTPASKPLAPAPKSGGAKKEYVRTVQGVMVDLTTNTQFTTDPKKVEINSFIQSQIDEGKLLISED